MWLPAKRSLNSGSRDGEKSELAAGAELKVDLFKVGEKVDVTGTTHG